MTKQHADSEPGRPLGLPLNNQLGRDAAEMPPWLLPLHEATLIANTYRVRVGVVQAIAKATHQALQADVDRLRGLIQRVAKYPASVDCAGTLLRADVLREAGPPETWEA